MYQNHAKLWKVIQIKKKVCNKTNAKVCKGNRKYATGCKSMQKYAKANKIV